jgi:chitinase
MKTSIKQTLVALALSIGYTDGHAFMTSPPSRQLVNDVAIDPKTSGPDGYSTVLYGGKRDGYAWRLADEDLASLNAQLGGGDAAKAKAQGHGLCGDDGPRGLFTTGAGFEGGAFDTAPQVTYAVGSTIDIDVTVTAHHLGWFEFRLCDDASRLSQECLNEHVLQFDADYTAAQYSASDYYGGLIQDPADYRGIENPTDYLGNGGAAQVETQCAFQIENESDGLAPVEGSCCRGGGACSPEAANADRWMVPDKRAKTTYKLKYDLPAGVASDHAVLQFMYVTANSRGAYPEAFFNCADIAIGERADDGDDVDAPPAPAPTTTTTAAPDDDAGDGGEGCACRSISHVTDAWCVAVDCDPAYAAFCSSACDDGDEPATTPAPTRNPTPRPTPKPTPRPTPRPTPPKATCEDSEAWFYKKERKDCAWVSKKPEKRCRKKGVLDGKKTKAKKACLEACDKCPDDESPVTPAPTVKPTAKPATPAPTAKPATPAPTTKPAPSPPTPPAPDAFERVGYVENWKPLDTSELDGFTTLLYSFLTLDATPNVDHPREVRWGGEVVYDTMTLADVLAVMEETDPAWENPHNWQKQKIDALIDYCRDTGKKFLWAFGGWSDLTKTVDDDQVEDLVDQLVQLLALGADGLDFDWEHLSQYRDSDPALHAQQRSVVGKVIASLKTALVAAGMGDKIISYTPRYNAFFPTTGSKYGQNNFATDGEGADIFDYLKAHSEFGVDAVDFVHLMMYDLDAQTAFVGAPEQYFVQEHYDAVVQSHVDYGIPLEKVVMGFEPGPQAYTGVWGGLEHDEATIASMKDAKLGGVMFWAVNDPKVASNGKTVGENSIKLANYAAAL